MAITWTKEWAAVDDGTIIGGADLKNIQDDVDTGFAALSSTGIGAFSETFNNGNLSAGVLTVTHNLAVSGIGVFIYDENSKLVVPDDVTVSTINECTVDFTSYGTLSGTWRVKVIG